LAIGFLTAGYAKEKRGTVTFFLLCVILSALSASERASAGTRHVLQGVVTGHHHHNANLRNLRNLRLKKPTAATLTR